MTLQKGIVYSTPTTHGKVENKPYCRGLDNGAKSIMIVNSRPLLKAFGNQPCFVPINKTVKISFSAKNSLAINYILTRSWSYKLPCPISNKGVIFLGHGPMPFRVFDGLGHSDWFYVTVLEELSGYVKFLNWFSDVIFGPSSHSECRWWLWESDTSGGLCVSLGFSRKFRHGWLGGGVLRQLRWSGKRWSYGSGGH